ncbi:hypothetical protein SDC9_186137 [bioreactor metagenome]|uniref:ABC-2 type transporter domain-containing protein n=1 Tax=bioreactor metagenome TaxID=1076179 RepID=A0A645HTA4_9ZZZZ
MMCFVVSFFKSQQAFSTASTIIGTLIGFLTGVYLPIGSLPASVQTIIKIFPVSHAASLFRLLMMEAPLSTAFEGLDAAYLSEFKEYMGITYSLGGHEITPLVSILILIGTSAVFYILAVFNVSRSHSVRVKGK